MWEHYKDNVALLYEIFGKNVTFLFSQIASSSQALNFFISPMLSHFLAFFVLIVSFS